MTKTISANLTAAFDLLHGTAVVSHDRRHATAHGIDYTTKRTPRGLQVRPDYGISNTMLKNLSKVASQVSYDEKSMPVFFFRNA